MAGPWEKYAQTAAPAQDGPWTRYSAPAPSWTENIWGRGEVDTFGERAGVAINDMLRAAGAGVMRGAAAIPDLPGQLMGLGGDLAFGALEAAGAVEPGTAQAGKDALRFSPLGSGSTFRDATSAATGGGSEFRGETTAGKYAGTVGEFLPGALLGGMATKAPMLGTAAAYAVAPGVLSEAAGQATEDVTLPEWIPGIGGQPAEPWARTAGAIAGPALANAAARVVTPNPAPPSRINAARRLESEGVKVTAGQRTGDAALRTREEYIPRTAQVIEDQAAAFTKAALRRIGADADRATSDVMSGALKRIGGMFDDLAGRNTISADRNLKVAADAALSAFDDLATSPDRAPVLLNIVSKIDDAVKTGADIGGDQYQAWRTRLGNVVSKTNDPALREGAGVLLNALDDAMERSLRAAGNADDLATYAKARQQYRDFLAIERAVSSAGGTSGIITPQAMRAAIVGQGRRAYVTGGRDLGELSKAANEVFPASHGNSGTQQRIWANMLPGAQSATPAGLLGYAISGGDPAITSASVAAGALAPAARNAMTGSAIGQTWLGNQILPVNYGLLDPRSAGIVSAVLGQEEKGAKQ